jgi:hypothetical protein
VVNFISIGGGAAPFNGAPPYTIDNINGVVRLNAIQSGALGPLAISSWIT